LITVAAALGVAGLLGFAWRRRNGTFRAVEGPSMDLTTLGWVAGTPVTLLQFSSAFCAPCRATRTLCTQTAAAVAGVRHVEVDAESHLSAVRALGILRTPTVLLVDASGNVVGRASGLPTRSQLLDAVNGVLAHA
jgi:thiol-disulfide isomerase/thioredoxin